MEITNTGFFSFLFRLKRRAKCVFQLVSNLLMLAKITDKVTFLAICRYLSKYFYKVTYLITFDS